MRPFDPLLAMLSEVPDPRRAEGKLYKLPYVLLFSILAVVTGGNSFRSIETFINVHRGRLNAAFGLQWQRDFAISHGKRMSYPEWGVGNFGDNPFFVQQMHDWFVKNADNIAYAAYFDVDGLWPTQIDNGQFPKSQLLFRKLFKRSAFLN